MRDCVLFLSFLTLWHIGERVAVTHVEIYNTHVYTRGLEIAWYSSFTRLTLEHRDPLIIHIYTYAYTPAQNNILSQRPNTSASGMYECTYTYTHIYIHLDARTFRDLKLLSGIRSYTGNHIPIVRYVTLIKLPVGISLATARLTFLV